MKLPGLRRVRRGIPDLGKLHQGGDTKYQAGCGRAAGRSIRRDTRGGWGEVIVGCETKLVLVSISATHFGSALHFLLSFRVTSALRAVFIN